MTRLHQITIIRDYYTVETQKIKLLTTITIYSLCYLQSNERKNTEASRPS